MAKPVVFVIGASGLVGSATVQVLSGEYADKVEIRAGTRNPDKADKLKCLSNVSVVQAEMGDDEKLRQTLKGVHALYIVTPGVENRAQLAIATAQAAKDAGVKHLLVVSLPTPDQIKDTVFGRHFVEIETAVSQLGVPYTFLRLPFFVENYFRFKDSIKEQGAIYCPVDGTKPFTAVAVADAAKAGAAILVDPTKHANKTYTIITDCYTYNDVAAAFSEVLKKTVTYNRVPYDAAKQAFQEIGFSEWEVTGLLELYKMIDSGQSEADISDFNQITGEQPTSLKAWVSQVKDAFV